MHQRADVEHGDGRRILKRRNILDDGHAPVGRGGGHLVDDQSLVVRGDQKLEAALLIGHRDHVEAVAALPVPGQARQISEIDLFAVKSYFMRPRHFDVSPQRYPTLYP
ncbi:MAG TPA: hypothetical protein VF574_16550 [Allosphingosinicella sp.]